LKLVQGGSGDPGVTVQAAFDNAYAAGVLHVAAARSEGPGYKAQHVRKQHDAHQLSL
jgi:hypothetical protein